MKRIVKTNKSNDIEVIKNDIEKTFLKLIKSPYQTYFITYGKFKQKSLLDIKFLLKNKLLNQIWRDNKYTSHIINYLYVIEYPEIITNPSLKYTEKVNQIDFHAHLVINTTLPELTLEYYIKTLLDNSDIDFQNITKRTDLEYLSGYLTKQINYFSNSNYDYKALIH